MAAAYSTGSAARLGSSFALFLYSLLFVTSPLACALRSPGFSLDYGCNQMVIARTTWFTQNDKHEPNATLSYGKWARHAELMDLTLHTRTPSLNTGVGHDALDER